MIEIALINTILTQITFRITDEGLEISSFIILFMNEE